MRENREPEIRNKSLVGEHREMRVGIWTRDPHLWG